MTNIKNIEPNWNHIYVCKNNAKNVNKRLGHAVFFLETLEALLEIILYKSFMKCL